MSWQLSENWRCSTDAWNWILERRKGHRWAPEGYYPNPIQLLESLHRKIQRGEVHGDTLEEHLDACLRRARACSAAFHAEVTKLGAEAYRRPQHKLTEREEVSLPTSD